MKGVHGKMLVFNLHFLHFDLFFSCVNFKCYKFCTFVKMLTIMEHAKFWDWFFLCVNFKRYIFCTFVFKMLTNMDSPLRIAWEQQIYGKGYEAYKAVMSICNVWYGSWPHPNPPLSPSVSWTTMSPRCSVQTASGRKCHQTPYLKWNKHHRQNISCLLLLGLSALVSAH